MRKTRKGDWMEVLDSPYSKFTKGNIYEVTFAYRSGAVDLRSVEHGVSLFFYACKVKLVKKKECEMKELVLNVSETGRLSVRGEGGHILIPGSYRIVVSKVEEKPKVPEWCQEGKLVQYREPGKHSPRALRSAGLAIRDHQWTVLYDGGGWDWLICVEEYEAKEGEKVVVRLSDGLSEIHGTLVMRKRKKILVRLCGGREWHFDKGMIKSIEPEGGVK